jgi:hypothetical protein
MSSSLIAELAARSIDSDSVHQATRYYLAQRLDDMTPDEMLGEMIAAVGDRPAVDAAITTLAGDPLLLENADLLFLSAAWSEDHERQRLSAVLDDAKGKLPVIEVAILAIVAMYGLYLWRTGGVKRSEKTIERKPDGSFVERAITDYAAPTGPLRQITSLFNAGGPPQGGGPV